MSQEFFDTCNCRIFIPCDAAWRGALDESASRNFLLQGELLKFYLIMSPSKNTTYAPMSTSLFEQLSFDAHFSVEPPTPLYEKVTARCVCVSARVDASCFTTTNAFFCCARCCFSDVAKAYRKIAFVEQECNTMHNFEQHFGESLIDAPFRNNKPLQLPNGDFCFQIVLPISESLVCAPGRCAHRHFIHDL